jgi:hypothetical protein
MPADANSPRVPPALIVAAFVFIAVLAGLLTRLPAMASKPADPNVEAARQLVQQWADRLDRQTTETGVYVRHPADTLPVDDPWGRPLRVLYTQGGLAEQVTVRSFGPDGQEYTADDVVAVRHAVNLKGVGEGVKKNAEETAHHTAKGLVKGLAAGAKEVVRGEK